MDLRVLEGYAEAAYSGFVQSVGGKSGDGAVLPSWSDISLSTRLGLMAGISRVISEAKFVPAVPPPVEPAAPPEAFVADAVVEGV